jgi:hypothetical protein
MEAHFRSIWVQDDANKNNIDTEHVVANIRSFAVSPDNQWVYVLRPGELALYGPCTDGTVNLDPAGKSFDGTPDCPKVPSRTATGDGTVWTVDPNIENIAVDFGTDLDSSSDDHVYSMYNSAVASGSALLSAPVPLPNAATFSWSNVNEAGFNIPADRPRIRGMFITQSFPHVASMRPNLFFFDNTCYTGATSTTSVSQYSYCASIFSASDTNMQQDMRELPLQVESISY